MTQLTPQPRRGFTILEIVMAVIIISILTLVLTPMLSSRSTEAKKRAAEQDLESLANAEERAAVDSGYFFRPYVLNDGIGAGDDEPAAPKTLPTDLSTLSKVEVIRDNSAAGSNGGNLYINPTKIFIKIKSDLTGTEPLGQDYMDNYADLFTRLTQGNPEDKAEEKFGWDGPYVNWRRDVNQNDWPDDPWGNDYLFFTYKGVIYPPDRNATIVANQTDTSDQFQTQGPQFVGSGGTQLQYDAEKIFDRPTFLSLGPNGVPGDGSNDKTKNGQYGKGDDIIYQFGGR